MRLRDDLSGTFLEPFWDLSGTFLETFLEPFWTAAWAACKRRNSPAATIRKFRCRTALTPVKNPLETERRSGLMQRYCNGEVLRSEGQKQVVSHPSLSNILILKAIHEIGRHSGALVLACYLVSGNGGNAFLRGMIEPSVKRESQQCPHRSE